jgi:hypothetical protein
MSAYELKRWVCAGYDRIIGDDDELQARATVTTPEGAQLEVLDVFAPAERGFLLTRSLTVVGLPQKRQEFFSSTSATKAATTEKAFFSAFGLDLAGVSSLNEVAPFAPAADREVT